MPAAFEYGPGLIMRLITPLNSVNSELCRFAPALVLEIGLGAQCILRLFVVCFWVSFDAVLRLVGCCLEMILLHHYHHSPPLLVYS